MAGEAARLKDCESVSRGRMGVAVETHVVALLPCTSSTESDTDCRGPRAALEEEEVFEVGELGELGDESQGDADEVLVGEGPAEEDEVGPEVEHLGGVDGWDVVGLVA